MDAPPGWEERDGRLRRRFVFPDYAHACAFAVGISRLAEEQDHHPTVVHSSPPPSPPGPPTARPASR
ncbi:MAG: 4a-hydroxytetrahydrobiopterin dehydratase [Planctomycetota bacterium]|jgi:pterin-4a-carbinolamine dehydratase